MHILEHIFCEKKQLFLFSIYPGVELLGHRVCIHLVLIDPANFPKKLYQFTFLPATNKGSKLLYK